jgi:hypothetical protein
MITVKKSGSPSSVKPKRHGQTLPKLDWRHRAPPAAAQTQINLQAIPLRKSKR